MPTDAKKGKSSGIKVKIPKESLVFLFSNLFEGFNIDKG
jgi:hypothetical protein